MHGARSKENCSDWVETKWQHHGRVWKISLDSEQQQQLQVWGNKQTKNGELETDIISGIFWLVDAAQLKSCNFNKNVQIVGYAFLHFMFFAVATHSPSHPPSHTLDAAWKLLRLSLLTEKCNISNKLPLHVKGLVLILTHAITLRVHYFPPVRSTFRLVNLANFKSLLISA